MASRNLVNWGPEMIPILKTPKYQELMRAAIRLHIGADDGEVIDKPWASYKSSDGYEMYLERANEAYLKKLVEEGKLDKDWNRVDDDDEEESDKVFALSEKLVEDAPHNKHWEDDINAYDFTRMCYAFNPIVAYQLALDLYPKEDWYVKETHFYPRGECIDYIGHATVVNRDETKYFDIVYATEDLSAIIVETMAGYCPNCHKHHRITSKRGKPPPGRPYHQMISIHRDQPTQSIGTRILVDPKDHPSVLMGGRTDSTLQVDPKIVGPS